MSWRIEMENGSTGAIDEDCYPLSPRVQTLTAIPHAAAAAEAGAVSLRPRRH